MKFFRHPTEVPVSSMRVVGTSNGPLSIPLGMVEIHTNGITSYDTLYSFKDAGGNDVLAAYPGSYGSLIAVRSARGGRY